MAFSPDGKSLAYGTGTQVQILSVPALKEYASFEGGPGVFQDVAFLPDGKTLALCTNDGQVQLWNLKTGRDVVTLSAHRQRASGLAISRDGNIMASSGADKTIRIWRAASGR